MYPYRPGYPWKTLNSNLMSFPLSIYFSSRPFTAQTPVSDEHAPHEILVLEDNDDISDLIFHTSDFGVTPIVDNP